MSDLDKIIYFAKKYGANLKTLPEASILKLMKLYVDVPSEYFDILRNVGFGNVIKDSCSIYSGFGDPAFIYDKETSKIIKDFLIIGDDCQGYCFGYEKGTWNIIEYDPTLGEFGELENSLFDYLLYLFEEYEEGFFI